MFIVVCQLSCNSVFAQETQTTVGYLFGRPVAKERVTKTLRVTRLFLTSKLGLEKTWQRLALLDYAQSQGLKVGTKDLIKEKMRWLRRFEVDRRLKQRLKARQQAPAMPLTKAEILKLRKKLNANWKPEKDSFEQFYKFLKLTESDFEFFATQQLQLAQLKAWNTKQILTADPELGQKTQKIQNVSVDWCKLTTDILPNLKVRLPKEVLARKFYQRERLRYRRKRLLKIAVLFRKDDGFLNEMAKARAQFVKLQSETKDKDLVIASLGNKKWQSYISELCELQAIKQPTVRQFVNSPTIEDLLNRSKRDSISQPLRHGGYQWLVQILETQAPKALSYEECGGLDPKGRLMKDWRRYAGLGKLLSYAHEIRKTGEQQQWLNWIPPSVKQSASNQVVTAKTQLQWPNTLKLKVLTNQSQDVFIDTDLARREIYMVYVRSRQMTPIPVKKLSGQQRQKQIELRLADKRDLIYAQAKGLNESILQEATTQFFASEQVLVRTMILPKPQGNELQQTELKTLRECFENGESLELIAARLESSEIPQVDAVAVPTPTMLTALELEPQTLSPVFQTPGFMSLQMVEIAPLALSNKQVKRVYQICFSTAKSKDQAATALDELRQKIIALPADQRLREFRRLAKTVSQTASAKLGGYCGALIHDPKPFRNSIRQALAVHEPGQRSYLDLGSHLAFLTLLDSHQISATKKKKHLQLLQRAQPWNDAFNR